MTEYDKLYYIGLSVDRLDRSSAIDYCKCVGTNQSCSYCPISKKNRMGLLEGGDNHYNMDLNME